MPYKGDVTLKFPSDETRNTLIVFGDNMRGKTSLLNAIRWGFYGKALGRHLREIPLQLIPNSEAAKQNDWHVEVRIEFESEGDKYDLRRIANKKPLIAKPERPEDFLIETHLQKNGAAVPANNIEAEINKFAPEQVSRFFLFDGELLQEYEELLIESSDQGKKIKEAIEQVLGVPSLTNGRADVYSLLKRAQKVQEQDAAKVKGMKGLAEQQRDWYVKRESYENDLSAIKESLKKTHDSRIELEDYLEKVDAVLKQKLEYDFLSGKRNQFEKDSEQLNTSRLNYISEAWRDLLTPKLELMRDQLIAKQNDLFEGLNIKVRYQTALDLKRQFLDNSICPTCQQSLDANRVLSTQNEILELEEKIKNLPKSTEDMTAISVRLNSINKIIGTSVVDRILDADRQLARNEHEISKAYNKLDDLKKEIEKYDTDEMLRSRKKRDQYHAEELKLLSDIRGIESNIAAADKELKIISQRISDDKTKSYTRGTIMAKLAESLHECFSKSIDELRIALKEKVEISATNAFKQMSTQQSYKGLKVNDNYGLKIINNDDEEVPIRSAGAEQIVALSLIDGLSKAGRSAGPVVMDTPFGRLDMKHRKNILSYLPKAATQLILFVHDGEIRGTEDLNVIAHRIGGQYEIKEISSTHSTIETR